MNDNNYLMLKVCVIRDQAEMAESAMLDNGALSCTYEDATDTPIHEPAPGTTPLWPNVIVTGIFAKGSDQDIITRLVTDEVRQFSQAEIKTQTLADTDWERAWMDEFKPVRITDGLWIVPTFCTPPDSSAVNIAIDPGLAFGSGTHPTTHLCLQWLASVDLKNKSVIDYGCGSGILAVAAALLGAAHVYAFDIEAQALVATQDNAAANSVADKVIICHTDADLPANADYVVANILLAPLIDLRPRLTGFLSEGGRLGVSGVLSDQLPVLSEAYGAELRHSQTALREQWAMYTATKSGAVSSQ